jgi:hypothetical protein
MFQVFIQALKGFFLDIVGLFPKAFRVVQKGKGGVPHRLDAGSETLQRLL